MCSHSYSNTASNEFFNPDGTYNKNYSVDCKEFQQAVWFVTTGKDAQNSREEVIARVQRSTEWSGERKELALDMVELVYSSHHSDKSGFVFRNFAKKLCEQAPRPESIPDNSNVLKFEVSGIRLGMSAQESIDKLVEYYSLNPEGFEIIRQADPMPLTGAKNVIERIRFNADGLRISITLDPDLERKDIDYMVVSEVEISDNRKDILERVNEANAALGAETYILKNSPTPKDPKTWRYYWCEKKYPDNSRCDSDYARLDIFANRTTLSTDVYWDRFRETWRKHWNK